MAKSTPVPLEDYCDSCDAQVFIAFHAGGGGGEILGVFTNEKAAKKCASSAKKDDGFKGKEAKEHAYTIEPWTVSDKFSE